jgi:Protein of unknown function (DUF2911)
MRPIRFTLAVIAAAAGVLPTIAQQTRISPHETISTVLGDRRTGNRVTITYGRPYTKDPKTGEPRAIWGGLVPWGKADRLGADEATLLTTQQTIMLGDATIPAGSYTLYTVPSETGASKLAISTNVGKWGVPVDETHDLARVDMAKSTLDAPVDQLTLAIEKGKDGDGLLTIKWATTEFTVPIKPPAAHIDFPQTSPAATLKQRIGLTDIEIVYSRPSARGRQMLGGINPYGQVWRTGANSATRISFSTPVTLQGAHVDAGTYEFFTIPGQDEWTVILQKPSKQWGAYTYDQKNDVLRVTARPVSLSETVETFTIDFGDIKGESATLNLCWEGTRVPVKVAVDTTATVLPQIDAVMAGSGRKPYANAALYYLDHNLDLGKAVVWMDAAIAEQPDAFYLIYQKARILAKKGDKEGAIAAATQSREMASKATGPEKDEYIRLNDALIASQK